MSVKKIFTTIFCLSLGLFVAQADSVNFISKPMTVGKALLADNAYSISHLLDIANFSPELRFPIQLVYNSSIEKSGLFGFAWRSPQLESSAYYDKDGVLWITPWGERIKFFPKDEKQPKDVRIASLFVKPGCLKVSLNIDYRCFDIENDFIVGYGLDYNQEGRNLPHIYQVVE